MICLAPDAHKGILLNMGAKPCLSLCPSQLPVELMSQVEVLCLQSELNQPWKRGDNSNCPTFSQTGGMWWKYLSTSTVSYLLITQDVDWLAWKTGQTCKLHSEKLLDWLGFKPGIFLLWDSAIHQVTVLPWRYFTAHRMDTKHLSVTAKGQIKVRVNDSYEPNLSIRIRPGLLDSGVQVWQVGHCADLSETHSEVNYFWDHFDEPRDSSPVIFTGSEVN